MKKEVIWTVRAVGIIVVAAIAGSGCMSDYDACASIRGEFMAVHDQVSGSCTLIQPTWYHFESGSTKATVYETDVGGTIITEINRQGCMMALTKTRLDYYNNRRWQMIGDMHVDTVKQISGAMTRYEWTEDGEITCQGSYSTVMTKVRSVAATPKQSQ